MTWYSIFEINDEKWATIYDHFEWAFDEDFTNEEYFHVFVYALSA